MSIDIEFTQKQYKNYLIIVSKFLLNRILTLLVGIIIFICSILLLVCFWFLSGSKEIETFIEQELGMSFKFPNIINYIGDMLQSIKTNIQLIFAKIYPKKKILFYIKKMLYLDEETENKKPVVDLTNEPDDDSDSSTSEWLDAYNLNDNSKEKKKIKLEIKSEAKNYNSSSDEEVMEEESKSTQRSISISPRKIEKSVYEFDKSSENLDEKNFNVSAEEKYDIKNKKNN